MKVLIVIPCYNEEEVLPKTLEVLGNLIKNIKKETDADTELLLVDDGSRDRTWISSMVCARSVRPIPSSSDSPPRLSIS